MINLEMKKATLALSSFGTTAILFFANAGIAFADINLSPTKPDQGIGPTNNVGQILGNAITIIFVIATLTVLFFLIIGAFNWITSGGDKERIGKARGTILNALIGLAVLALAFVIWSVVGQIVNVNTSNLSVPSLNKDT